MTEKMKRPSSGHTWSPYVESMSDGNNGWGEEQTEVCSWCGERSPDGHAYGSLFEFGKSVCPGCHELEEMALENGR